MTLSRTFLFLRSSALVALVLLLSSAALAAATPDITAANLLEQERWWPYRASLTEDWSPKEGVTLKSGTQGVVIRVEPGGLARVDFSSDGKYSVPVAKTDLVQNANRIRRGELEKTMPNFTYAITSRLLDSASDAPGPLKPQGSQPRPGFLCVFANPSDKDFPALAAALAPLQDRHDVLTILFPVGDHKDREVRDRLRALNWRVPYLYNHLSEVYAVTLINPEDPIPSVLLQTDEGRVILNEPFSFDLVPRLTAALDATFGGSAPIAKTTSAPQPQQPEDRP